MSGLTHNVSAEADALLDHIYEYGTNSEGVIHRINRLCDAAVEQLRAERTSSGGRRLRRVAWSDGFGGTFETEKLICKR